MILVTVGERIRNLRLSLDIPQVELAMRVGISKQNLYKYETGIITNIPADKLEAIASALKTTPAFLAGWEEPSNISAIYNDKIYNIPLYESVSAGFGAYADDYIVDYVPLRFTNAHEASETLCIKVSGDSMSPNIKDGDTIIVHKQDSVDSGDIAVLLIDGEEAVVKKVIYDAENIELHSFNPLYPVRTFSGADVLRVRVVGKVKKRIEEISEKVSALPESTRDSVLTDLLNNMSDLTEEERIKVSAFILGLKANR
jgi:repressor LexA